MARLVLNENSYVDLVTAEEFIPKFFETTSWSSLTDGEKENTLIHASRVVDLRFSPFLSSAITPTQSMAFPRKSFNYWDPVLNIYVSVPEGVVPPRVQKCVMYLANHFAEYRSTLFAGEDHLDWATVSIDSLSISKVTREGVDVKGTSTAMIPYEARLIIEPLTLYGNTTKALWWRAN
jgi:hypothetical protein